MTQLIMLHGTEPKSSAAIRDLRETANFRELIGHLCTYVLQVNCYTVQFGRLVTYLANVTFALLNSELNLWIRNSSQKAAKFKPPFDWSFFFGSVRNKVGC